MYMYINAYTCIMNELGYVFSRFFYTFATNIIAICTLYILPCVKCIHAVPLGEVVELSNKDLKLLFNESGHLSSWTDLQSGVKHSVQHDYLQRAEKESVNEWNVCDGTNVYTFVPDKGVTQLTPMVYI